MDRTVAVIGGSGFLGRAVIERLTREGARVVVLCRNAERAKFLKPMGVVGQVTLVAGNALNHDDLEQVMAPADAVINLIGILAEGGSQKFATLQGLSLIHISEPTRLLSISYAVFCLKKKK